MIMTSEECDEDFCVSWDELTEQEKFQVQSIDWTQLSYFDWENLIKDIHKETKEIEYDC